MATGDATALGTAAVTLTLLVGLMLMFARLLRIGFLASFISDPVLTGFKAGIGFVIVVDQLPKLLGIHIHKAGFFRDLLAIIKELPAASIATVLVALGSFVVIGVFHRFAPKAPAPLLVVAGAITCSLAFALPDAGVSVVGAIPGGFPSLTLPDYSLFMSLWPAAAGIALMSFTESIAAGRAFHRVGTPRPDANQELLALGAANALASLFGAMPAGGGTSQTAVNANAGARTQVAGLVTAAGALATMLFLAPAMGALPYATLAAVVVAYSIGLIDPKEILAIRRVRVYEFRWAIAALLGVMVLGTLKGILVAVIVSIVSLISQSNSPPVYAVRRRKGTDEFEPITDGSGTDSGCPGLLIARVEGRAFFGNVQNIGEKLRALIDAATPRVVIFDSRAIIDFEYTALKALVEAQAEFSRRGIDVWFAALNPSALEQIRRTSLAETLGEQRIFASLHTAVASYEAAQAPAGAAG